MEELTVRQATELLAAYGTQREQLNFDRDEVVRLAYASGIGMSRIAQLTGLGRSTVQRILRKPRMSSSEQDCST